MSHRYGNRGRSERLIRYLLVGLSPLATACSSNDDAFQGAQGVGTSTSALSSKGTPASHPALHRSPAAIAEDGPIKNAPPGPITYNGGAIMKGTVNIYSIFYGNFPTSGDNSPQDPRPGAGVWQDYIGTFVNSLSGSSYLGINATYPDASGQFAATQLHWSTSIWDNSNSQGTNLSEANIRTLIANNIASGVFPTDTNGIYMLFGGSNIGQFEGLTLMCQDFCGWHNSATAAHTTINGVDIKYAFIGDPEHCSTAAGCAANTSGTPSGNYALDAIVSATTHEIEESITDPDVTAYFDDDESGTIWENEDRCAYEWGPRFKETQFGVTGSGNVRLNNTWYLIQENWVNQGTGYCYLRAAEPAVLVISQQGLRAIQAIRNGVRVTTSAINVGADGAVYSRLFQNGSWSAATSLSARGIAPPGAGLATVQASSTQTDLLLVGNDGKVYATSQTNSGPWQALAAITPANFAIPGAMLTAATVGGQLEVFVVDTASKLQMISWTAAHGWSAPTALSTGSFAPPGAVLATGTRANGEFDVFAVGTDGALKYYFFNLGIWGGPLTLTGTSFAPPGAAVTAATDVHGFLNVMTIGNSGALYTDWDVTPAWSGPTALTATGFAPAGGSVSAINLNNQSLNAFFVNGAGAAEVLSNNGSGWQAAKVITTGVQAGAPIAPVAQGTSEFDAFISSSTAKSGVVESINTAGTWSAPVALP